MPYVWLSLSTGCSEASTYTADLLEWRLRSRERPEWPSKKSHFTMVNGHCGVVGAVIIIATMKVISNLHKHKTRWSALVFILRKRCLGELGLYVVS